MQETFTQVYKRNEWLIDSGPGSTVEYNKDFYIPFLRKYIIDNNIKKVADCGCGDFKCGKLIYDEKKKAALTHSRAGKPPLRL